MLDLTRIEALHVPTYQDPGEDSSRNHFQLHNRSLLNNHQALRNLLQQQSVKAGDESGKRTLPGKWLKIYSMRMVRYFITKMRILFPTKLTYMGEMMLNKILDILWDPSAMPNVCQYNCRLLPNSLQGSCRCRRSLLFRVVFFLFFRLSFWHAPIHWSLTRYLLYYPLSQCTHIGGQHPSTYFCGFCVRNC